MNLIILLAGVLAMIAFIAHVYIGDIEYRTLKPASDANEKLKDAWIQGRSGWHWVSVDLLAIGLVLIFMAVSNRMSFESELLLLLSAYFFVCGLVWLVTVFLSRNRNKQILVLGQWIFCLVMSGLIFWGS